MNGADGRRGTRSSARAATAAGIAGVGVVGICIAWLAVPSAVPRRHTTDVHLDAPIPAAATTTVVTRTNAELVAMMADAGAGSTGGVPAAQHQSYLAAPTTSEAPPSPDGTPAPLIVVPSSTVALETAVSIGAEPAAVLATTSSSTPTTTTALPTPSSTASAPSTAKTTTTVANTVATTKPTVTLPSTTVDTVAPTNPTQDAPASQEISQ